MHQLFRYAIVEEGELGKLLTDTINLLELHYPSKPKGLDIGRRLLSTCLRAFTSLANDFKHDAMHIAWTNLFDLTDVLHDLIFRRPLSKSERVAGLASPTVKNVLH